MPHTYLDAFREPAIVFVRLSHPINLGALDGVPTRFGFVMMGPTGAVIQHLDSLANIARLMSDDEFRFDAGEAKTQLDLLTTLDRFNERTSPHPDPRRKYARKNLFTHQGCLPDSWLICTVGCHIVQATFAMGYTRSAWLLRCSYTLPVLRQPSRSAGSWENLRASKSAQLRCWLRRLFVWDSVCTVVRTTSDCLGRDRSGTDIHGNTAQCVW